MSTLTQLVKEMLELDQPLELFLEENRKHETVLIEKTNEIIQLTQRGSREARLDLLRSLYLLQDEIFRYPLDKHVWNHEHPLLYKIRFDLTNTWQNGWINETTLDLDQIPKDPREFNRWLRSYCENHSLFEHPLLDYLKKNDLEDFRAYFYYGDMLDLPQVELYARSMIGLPDESPRIEISKNYWDEMGVGIQSQCHGIWAERFLDNLNLLDDDRDIEQHFFDIPEKCIEKFILAQYIALTRGNWLKVIGHLGATEIYDPKLNVTMIELGRKFGFDDKTLEYFIQHIKVDAIHSRDWLNKVVKPIIEEDPEYRFEIARGAELNLTAMQRSFDDILMLLKNNEHQIQIS
jgi:hypothetical protein